MVHVSNKVWRLVASKYQHLISHLTIIHYSDGWILMLAEGTRLQYVKKLAKTLHFTSHLESIIHESDLWNEPGLTH